MHAHGGASQRRAGARRQSIGVLGTDTEAQKRAPSVTTDALYTRLRLVHPPAPGAPLVPSDEIPSPRTARAAARRVAGANHDASTLSTEQMRDAFAARVAESLEGGKNAILRPESRARLIDLGARMGIRRFDAHLVIALTQDAARRGEVHTKPDDNMSSAIEGNSGDVPMIPLAIAVVLGLAIAMLAIGWLGAF